MKESALDIGRYNECNNIIMSTQRKSTSLKVTKIGNSLGVILPKEVLGMLGVGAGDSVHATAAPDGILLTPFDPEFERQMEIADRIMRKDRDILRALSK